MTLFTIKAGYGFNFDTFNVENFTTAASSGDGTTRTQDFGDGITTVNYRGAFDDSGNGTINEIIRLADGDPIWAFRGLNLATDDFNNQGSNDDENSGAANFLTSVMSGDDQVYGGNVTDLLRGFDGNDLIVGLGGADTLYGGTGNDALNGGDGIDTLSGDDGTDVLTGGDADDTLYGGGGIDVLIGGKGFNFLTGDGQAPVTDGDANTTNGGDYFVIGGGAGDGGGRDLITDFQAGVDHILVQNSALTTADIVATAGVTDGGSTVFDLGDDHMIVALGVTGANASWFL